MSQELTNGIDQLAENSRYPVDSNSDFRATVRRSAGESLEATSVRDLSMTGIRLEFAQEIATKEVVTIHILSATAALDFEVSAKVAWTEKQGAHWVAGFQFSQRLPGGSMANLAAKGTIDVKRGYRIRAFTHVLARWKGNASATHATLHDFGSGGFCISDRHAANIGDTVQVVLTSASAEEQAKKKAVVVKGRVCWRTTLGAASMHGCSFKRAKDFTNLARYMTEIGVIPAGVIPIPERSRRRWIKLGVPIAAGLAGLTFLVSKLLVN